MRALNGLHPPRSLRKWLKENQHVPGFNYSMLSGQPKNDLKSALLQNQGFLCAYTELRLDGIQHCHIEHIIPQNQSPDLDLTLTNLVACHPADGGDSSLGYGAPFKAGQWIRLGQNFLSPYAGVTADTFSFDQAGSVQGNSPAAQETIALLNLNHPSLQELRQRAIQAHGLSLRKRNLRAKAPQAKPLSAAQARALARQLLKPNAQGEQAVFCTALMQAAEKYAQQEAQRAKRLKKRKDR